MKIRMIYLVVLLTIITVSSAQAQNWKSEYKVFVNFSKDSAAVAPWNNTLTAPASGLSITDLSDDTGSNSGINLAITSDWTGDNDGALTEGAVTGANTGVYLDKVISEFYYFGIFNFADTMEMTLSGLDEAYAYDVTFFGSSKWDGVADNGITKYTIGNQFVTLDVQDNTTETVTIYKVRPDQLNNIIIELTKLNEIGVINAMVIEAYSPVAQAPGTFDQLIVGETEEELSGEVEVWIEGNPGAGIYLNEPTQGADEKLWSVTAEGTRLAIKTNSDDLTQAEEAMVLQRGTGTSVDYVSFPNGNVGIGTENATSALTVAGEVHAQLVKVTVDAGSVPDYVFADDYNRLPLEEVEKYVSENKHLPNIKSAQEYEDAGGVELKELNLKLLEKIEELTLYIIEQNKKISRLEKIVESNQRVED